MIYKHLFSKKFRLKGKELLFQKLIFDSFCVGGSILLINQQANSESIKGREAMVYTEEDGSNSDFKCEKKKRRKIKLHRAVSDLPEIPERVILNISLCKPTNEQLGIIISGGSETMLNGVFVKRISKGGFMEKMGMLKEGDQILVINEESLDGLMHAEVAQKLRSCSGNFNLIIARMIESKPQSDSNLFSLSPFHKRLVSCDSYDDEPDILEYKPIL